MASDIQWNLRPEPIEEPEAAIETALICKRPEVATKTPRARRTRVCILDGMTLRRECLLRTLRVGARDLDIDGAASCGGAMADPEQKPDIVLFNINVASLASDWVRSTIAELQRHVGAPILILSDVADSKAALQAVAMGLRGYVPTSVDVGLLVAAIRLVLAGGTFITQDIVADFAKHSSESPPEDNIVFLGFTRREAEVIEKIQQGKINKTIAYELNISESTVKIHVRHVMKKLKATNRTQVAFLVQRRAAGTHDSL
jgi:DNA-binding NarL/FixJ family response regulator